MRERVLRSFRALLAALLLLASFPALAQVPGLPAPAADAAAASPDSQEALKNLITVLKDDTARQELIDKLEAEMAAPETPPDAAANLPGDALTFGGRVGEMTQKSAEAISHSLQQFWRQLLSFPTLLTSFTTSDYGAIGRVLASLLLLVIGTYGTFLLARLATQRFRDRLRLRGAREGWLAASVAVIVLLATNLALVVFAWAIGYVLALVLIGEAGELAFYHTLFLNAFLVTEGVQAVIRALLAPRRAELRLLPVNDEIAFMLTRWCRIAISVLAFGILLIVPLLTRNIGLPVGRAGAALVYVLVLVLVLNLILRIREPVTRRLKKATGNSNSQVLRILARSWPRPGHALCDRVDRRGADAAGSRAARPAAGHGQGAGRHHHRHDRRQPPDPPHPLRRQVAAERFAARAAARTPAQRLRAAPALHPALRRRHRRRRLRARYARPLRCVRLAGIRCRPFRHLGGGDGVAHRRRFVPRLADAQFLDRLPDRADGAPLRRRQGARAHAADPRAQCGDHRHHRLCRHVRALRGRPQHRPAPGLGRRHRPRHRFRRAKAGAGHHHRHLHPDGGGHRRRRRRHHRRHFGLRRAPDHPLAGLRDLYGNYHIVPFSSVSIVTNSNRGFSFAVFELAVDYREDVAAVRAAMEEAFAEVHADPALAADFLTDKLEWMGIIGFAGNAMTVRARIKTRPSKQGGVVRVYNDTIKRIFAERGIRTPLPQAVYLGAEETPAALEAPAETPAKRGPARRKPRAATAKPPARKAD